MVKNSPHAPGKGGGCPNPQHLTGASWHLGSAVPREPAVQELPALPVAVTMLRTRQLHPGVQGMPQALGSGSSHPASRSPQFSLWTGTSPELRTVTEFPEPRCSGVWVLCLCPGSVSPCAGGTVGQDFSYVSTLQTALIDLLTQV